MATKNRKEARRRIHDRIRRKLSGTGARPRLSVYFSNQNVYAQIIDDEKGATLVAASTVEKGVSDGKSNAASAALIGARIGEIATAKGITNVVFDRGGFTFHGKVKALADAAREKGLKF